MFVNVAEKDDWVAKMKDLKVDFARTGNNPVQLPSTAMPAYCNNGRKTSEPPQETDASKASGGLPSGAESPSTSSMWERKYHLEVEIRSELKKVLDQTMAQMNALREGTANPIREMACHYRAELTSFLYFLQRSNR